MTMTYTATLTCGSCKATLTFTDERPDWKTFDYRVEMADECEKSARFVTEHADKPMPELGEARPAWWPTWDASLRFVSTSDFSLATRAPDRHLVLDIPEPYRYVDCPVCDAHVKAPVDGPRWIG